MLVAPAARCSTCSTARRSAAASRATRRSSTAACSTPASGANGNAALHRRLARSTAAGTPAAPTSFQDYAVVDLRLFADLNQRTKLIEQVPLLKNTRLTLSVNNVFDARQTIVNSSGEVPLRYQPFLVDPVGRFVEIELRKLF